MGTVLRVKDIRELGIPEIMAQLGLWTPNELHWTLLAQNLYEGSTVAWVGLTANPPACKGLLVLDLPKGLAEQPQVAWFSCQGGPQLKNEMIRSLLAFLRQAGYTRFQAINHSALDDAAWIKAFRAAGKPVKIASVFEYTVGVTGGRRSKKPLRRVRTKAAVHKHAAGPDAGRVLGSARAVRGQPKGHHRRRRPTGLRGPVQRPDHGRGKRRSVASRRPR